MFVPKQKGFTPGENQDIAFGKIFPQVHFSFYELLREGLKRRAIIREFQQGFAEDLPKIRLFLSVLPSENLPKIYQEFTQNLLSLPNTYQGHFSTYPGLTKDLP